MEEQRLNEVVDKLIEILCSEQDADTSQLGLEEFSYEEKREILRVLSIRRQPSPLSSEFLKLQNELLLHETKERGVVDVEKLSYIKNMSIFKGDIRTLKADAIVNAGNPTMLGSFDPTDTSIDAVIMMAGGLQIRQELSVLTARSSATKRGKAIITKAYNLPCKYILHTAGPEIKPNRVPSYKDKLTLSECYKSCLNLAKEKELETVAFCAISTGVYNFPKELACKIAVYSVYEWLKENDYCLRVVFCVFDDENKKLYETCFNNYDIR